MPSRFDVEEYFQVTGFAGAVNPAHWDLYEPRAERSTDRLLELLAAADVRATFFVLGWMAKRCPGLVRRIAAGRPRDRVARLLAPTRYDADAGPIPRRRSGGEGRVGRRRWAGRSSVIGPRAFRSARTCDWAFDVLVEEGHEFDSSVAAGRRESCGHLALDGRPFVIDTPAGPLREFPLPTARVLGRSIPVGGGGYFRLMPYAADTAGVAAIERGRRPGVRLPAPVGN